MPLPSPALVRLSSVASVDCAVDQGTVMAPGSPCGPSTPCVPCGPCGPCGPAGPCVPAIPADPGSPSSPSQPPSSAIDTSAAMLAAVIRQMPICLLLYG